MDDTWLIVIYRHVTGCIYCGFSGIMSYQSGLNSPKDWIPRYIRMYLFIRYCGNSGVISHQANVVIAIFFLHFNNNVLFQAKAHIYIYIYKAHTNINTCLALKVHVVKIYKYTHMSCVYISYTLYGQL